MRNKSTNWATYFERPDTSYPDYDRYLGWPEDRPEYWDSPEDEYLEDDDETEI